ncbi:MAG: hypothetical protein EYC70_12050 [Planctomycetota bacterium]|nr:MAG: hypothetical protein EYC70_12050 [Planctomycetota bacterium]
MTHRHRLLFAAGALCAGAGLLLAGQDAAPAPLSAAPVAFVDMDRCIQEHAPFRAEVDKLRQDFEGVLKSFEERKQKLAELETELSVLERGSAEYVAKSYQYDTEKVLYERDNTYQSDRLNAQRIQIFLRTYPRIQAAAAAVGARLGCAAMVTMPPPLDPQEIQADPMGAYNKLQSRSLLWASAAYDVTQQVVEELRKSS